MIQFSKGLDGYDDCVKAREQSISKPDFQKDCAEYIKKYQESMKYVPIGYHFVPSGQGETLQLCGPFYRETEESMKLREEFEEKYPFFDYVAPWEEWNMYFATMKKGDKEKMSESYKGPNVDCMGNPIEPAPGTSMHRDPIGPQGEPGDGWKSRLSREYHDTKVRYELLHIHNVKEKAKRVKEVYDVSTTEQKNSQELLFRQENIMREYLDVLEIRMAMAGLAI